MNTQSTIALLLSCIILLITHTSALSRHNYRSTYYEKEFAIFVKNFRRVYSAAEFIERFDIFKNNLEFIIEHNNARESDSAVLGIGPHADLTRKEFAATRLGYKERAADSSCMTSLYDHIDPLPELNWNDHGAVTPIKDQMSCGACYAFSSAAAIETAWFLQSGELVSLSEQQLIDCSSGSSGCAGGWYTDTFQYVVENGICSDADYSYVGSVNPYCESGMCNAVAKLNAWSCVEPENQTALLLANNLGAISVSISASSEEFQHYSSGILTDADCNGEVDHAVVVVGYGQDSSSGQKYWIIKNSWGAQWGMAGFANIQFDSPLCAILSSPAFPIV